MQRTYTRRRTRTQWQKLIGQWKHSDQSVKQFCLDQGLSEATFYLWRKRLSDAESSNDHRGDASEPDFIDIGALATTVNKGRWHITPSLGNGVELKLSQD